MKPLSLVLSIFLSLSSFAQTTPGYQLSGTVTGLAEGAWLYLRLDAPDQDFDSCQLRSGSFVMKGRIREKASRAYLHTRGYTDYTGFWLENRPIQFQLQTGQFKKGTITGSASEDEDRKRQRDHEPLALTIDSLKRARKGTRDSLLRNSIALRIGQLEEEQQQQNRDYIRHHPQSAIAANLLNTYASAWGRDSAMVLYEKLSADIKSTRYGREIKDFVSLNKSLTLGSRFVDFEQPNLEGKPVRLSDIKGKYVLIDFWASWCAPCREENPLLVATYAAFKDKGFAILGVSLDNRREAWQKAVLDDGLSWEQVSDLRGDKNRAALIYGISGIPDNFLVDAKGMIVARNLRGAELERKLRELLD